MRDYSDMREVFPDEPLPALLAPDRMWDEIELVEQPNGPAVEEWCHEMRKCYVNGAVFFKRFNLSPHPILHWMVSHGRIYGYYNDKSDDVGFFNNFVKRAQIAELKLKRGDKLSVTSANHLSPYLLDGTIAWGLLGGGAYKKFSGTPQEAKELGSRVCAELFGTRWDEVFAFQLHSACAIFSGM